MTDEELWGVMRPKAVGASTFSSVGTPQLTQLLFSSTSAVWSQLGAGHYAAANAFLDASATADHAAGLPSTSVQFGPFGGVGMAAEHGAALGAIGLRTLDPSEVSCFSQSCLICQVSAHHRHKKGHTHAEIDTCKRGLKLVP